MDEATYVNGFHDPREVTKMSYNELGQTGIRVSHLGLGGGPFGGLYEDMGETEAVQIVVEAIKSGVNYIDTAPWYGQGRSEARIGKALRKIPRKAYYIGTKVGRYEPELEKMFDFSAQKTMESVEKSLQLLGLQYVDIIQVHDLEFAENLEQVINETLPALEEIVKQGKARFIGITGYPLSILKEVLEKSTVRIDTVLSYCRCTLINEDIKNYLPYFKEKNLGVFNAGLVAMGLLTPEGGPSWHPATKDIKETCQRALEYSKKNKFALPEIAIKYSMMRQGIACHLLGSGTLQILRDNLKLATEKITEQELKYAEELKKTFFNPVPITHWENVREEYFEKLKKKRLVKKV